jgi:hypothetical protein
MTRGASNEGVDPDRFDLKDVRVSPSVSQADDEFVFEIRLTMQLGHGHGDVTLIGPRSGSGGSLSVGDTLEVPMIVEGSTRLVKCVEFPLVSLVAPGSATWVRVSVTGIRSRDVRVGGWAVRVT